MLTSKHIVEEINGIRCTIVEKGISYERVVFLKELLVFNKLEVIIAEVPSKEENVASSFTIGVTDIIFNPTIAVYEMSLKTKDGKSVSPAYWNQKTNTIVDEYWTFK